MFVQAAGHQEMCKQPMVQTQQVLDALAKPQGHHLHCALHLGCTRPHLHHPTHPNHTGTKWHELGHTRCNPQILFKAQKLNMSMTIIVMSQFLAKGLEDSVLVVGFLVVLDEWELHAQPIADHQPIILSVSHTI